MKIAPNVRVRYRNRHEEGVAHTGIVLSPSNTPGCWFVFVEGGHPGALRPTIDEDSMTVIPDPKMGSRVEFRVPGAPNELRTGRITGVLRDWPASIPAWIITLDGTLPDGRSTLGLTADQFIVVDDGT